MKNDLIDDCLVAFREYFGERGWRMDTHTNPSGYVKFINKDTHQLWIGWKSAWELQDARVNGATCMTKEPIDEKPPRKDYGLIPCPFCGNLPHVGLGKKRHCQLHGEPMQGVLVYCTSNNCVVKPLLVAGDIYNGGEEAARKVAFATWNRRL